MVAYNTPGFIYAARWQQFLKIGFTTRPAQRAKEMPKYITSPLERERGLGSKQGKQIEYLGFCPAYGALEREIHKRFDSERIFHTRDGKKTMTEWFLIGGDIERFVDTLPLVSLKVAIAIGTKGKPIDLSGNEFACRQCRNLYCTCPKPVDPNLGRLFCPNCNHEIETKGLIGRLLAYQSKTHNGGRPRSAIRCQCGVMTLARANSARRKASQCYQVQGIRRKFENRY